MVFRSMGEEALRQGAKDIFRLWRDSERTVWSDGYLFDLDKLSNGSTQVFYVHL